MGVRDELIFEDNTRAWNGDPEIEIDFVLNFFLFSGLDPEIESQAQDRDERENKQKNGWKDVENICMGLEFVILLDFGVSHK